VEAGSSTNFKIRKMKYIEYTQKDVIELYRLYNKLYFNGQLRMPRITFTPGGIGRGGLYSCRLSKKLRKPSQERIWLNSEIYFTEKTMRELLVHEMLHQYLRMVGRADPIVHGWNYTIEAWKLKWKYGVDVHAHWHYNLHWKCDREFPDTILGAVAKKIYMFLYLTIL